jgi:hypothetical protein
VKYYALDYSWALARARPCVAASDATPPTVYASKGGIGSQLLVECPAQGRAVKLKHCHIGCSPSAGARSLLTITIPTNHGTASYQVEL